MYFFFTFSLLSFSGLVFTEPNYNFITKADFPRISECARLAAHFSINLDPEVYKGTGCNINPRFSDNILAQVLSGVNLTANQFETSFKKPIEKVNFAVPIPWKKEWPGKSSHHKRHFGKKNDVETPTYMFTTVDGRFLIAPISKLDFESFPEGLPHYAKHLKATPDSLLIRVVRLFSVDDKYYAIFVTPFSLKTQHLVLQFSHEATDDNFPKHWGVYPFGSMEWDILTDRCALPIAELDETRFQEAYEKDMKFLNKHQYVNYEFMISTVNGTVVNINKVESTYESHYSILFEGEYRPVSVSITNIFRKTKKEEKSSLYCQSFDLFRKSKVVYGNSESKKGILGKKQ